MNYSGTRCLVERFSTSGMETNASFDTSEIVGILQAALEKQLAKKGLIVGEERSKNEVVVKGRFVRIDEGDRFLRYFLTFLAGKATVEVDGELFYGGRKVIGLHAAAKRSAGLFGGNSKSLVSGCATSCGQKIAKQVIASLDKLQEHP